MNYQSLAVKVLRLIGEYGAAMTIRQARAGTFNPGTGQIQGSSQDAACLGLLDSYGVDMVDGTSVLAGDRRVYLAAQGLGLTPQPGDQLLSGSLSFNLVKVDSVGPGGIILFYDIQARQ